MTGRKKSVDGMIDISLKAITKRTAVASCFIQLSQEAYQRLIAGSSPKGDVFETAKVAGIMAAKKVPDLIPMCHPLAITKAKISFNQDELNYRIYVKAEVACLGKTGVEMEALTAASTAALTIYDMMKWADKSMVVNDLKLELKRGGKSGVYKLKK